MLRRLQAGGLALFLAVVLTAGAAVRWNDIARQPADWYAIGASGRG